MPPTLSLCLATYNRAHYLERYLTHHVSALEAAGVDYELVISDNCSTDETPAILARHADANPRLRVARQATNVGMYPNVLSTLYRARGEIVVSIADDDLAVFPQLLIYVQRMLDDPSLVMVQSPWLLRDEQNGDAIMGKFYDLEVERRLRVGDYANCLEFVIQNQVFPECSIVRRAIIPSIIAPPQRFVFSFLAMLAHALGKGDVLFCPEPHILATAISKDAEVHVGDREAMESWDTYRGGLELLASYARQFNPGGLPDTAAVGRAIQRFVWKRMAVAARLQARARHWSNAYQILRRLHAYDLTADFGVDYNRIARLAAIETALLECRQRGAEIVVLGADVTDDLAASIKVVEGLEVFRAEVVGSGNSRRAYCSDSPPPDGLLRDGDFHCDLAAVIERFPDFRSARPQA